MHILFLTHYFPPEVNAPASRTYEHAQRWVRQPGVRVTVLTNHPHHPRGKLFAGHANRWFAREEMDGITVCRVKTWAAAKAGFLPRVLNFVFYMAMAVLMSLRVGRPDVVVATSPQFFCALGGWLVSLLKWRPFVFEVRDLWPKSIVAVGAMEDGFIVRLLERLELFLYRRAVLVVVVTDAFKKNLVRRGIPPAKVRVVKNSVDLDFFSPRPKSTELRRELDLDGHFVAAYIGTVGLAHGVDRLVEVAERLKQHPQIVLLVVGEGARREPVRKSVARRQLPNIRVLPGVTRERVRDFYALADLNLVTLRKKDIFTTVIPSKIFEIMGMARPILTSVDGESRGIIEQAGAGVFVEPENVEEMAEAILALSRDPDRLRRMGLAGRHYVEQHFSRDEAAVEYLGLLRQVCGTDEDEISPDCGIGES